MLSQCSPITFISGVHLSMKLLVTAGGSGLSHLVFVINTSFSYYESQLVSSDLYSQDFQIYLSGVTVTSPHPLQHQPIMIHRSHTFWKWSPIFVEFVEILSTNCLWFVSLCTDFQTKPPQLFPAVVSCPSHSRNGLLLLKLEFCVGSLFMFSIQRTYIFNTVYTVAWFNPVKMGLRTATYQCCNFWSRHH